MQVTQTAADTDKNHGWTSNGESFRPMSAKSDLYLVNIFNNHNIICVKTIDI